MFYLQCFGLGSTSCSNLRRAQSLYKIVHAHKCLNTGLLLCLNLSIILPKSELGICTLPLLFSLSLELKLTKYCLGFVKFNLYKV